MLLQFLICCTSVVDALDIIAGSAVPRRYDPATIALLARPLVVDSSSSRPTIKSGSAAISDVVALGELIPLMAEVWKIEARSDSGNLILEDADLGERLFDMYISVSGDTLDFIARGKRLRGVERLVLSCELLAEKNLDVWVSWEGVPELKAEASRFATAGGVSVKVTDVPNTQTKLLAVARAGGNLPDVVMIQSDYAPALASAKIIQSVEYLRTDDLVTKGFSAFSHDGKVWALPFYFDSQLVFYNRQMVGRDINPDWSTDDLERLALSVSGSGAGNGSSGNSATVPVAGGRTSASGSGDRKEKGLRVPMAWNAYSAYWLLPFIAGFGKSSLLEPDGSLRVNDLPTSRALNWLVDLRDRGLLEPAERDAMIAWFATGRTAFILSGSYSIPEFSRLGIDFGVAPYPVVSATGKPLAPLLDFKGLAIGRRTKRPVLARRFVQYMTSPPVQASFTSRLFKLPASRIAMESSKTTNRFYPQLARSYETGWVVPPEESYGAFKNVMWKLLRFLFTGQMDVPAILGMAEKLMAENLAEP